MEPPRENADILWLDTVDSTNSVLRERYPQSANLSIIAAREQTRGRGQGEHSWFSTPGKNLTFSILYRFGPDAPYLLEASHAIVITQITTLALRDYLGSRGIASRIKWPNDIWVGERKICGILIENKVTGRYMDASIVGIGLNVNEEAWPPQLPNPVSMKDLTGMDYALSVELVELRARLASRYAAASSDAGRKALDSEFREHMFILREEP